MIPDFKYLRGGSWNFNPDFARAVFRAYDYPFNRGYGLGFRVVCYSDTPISAVRVRGGSWFYYGYLCRSANRGILEPGSRDDAVGFRVITPKY